MMRLDHNRALTQVAQKIGKPVPSVNKMTIWGNHSATQYPDLFQAEVDGKKVWPADQRPGLAREYDFIPDHSEARRGDHRSARPVLRRQRGQRRDRPHPRLGLRHARRRLGQHGHSLRRQLRHRRRRDVRLSRAPARTANTKSSKASRSATSAARACRRRSRNCTKSATASSTCSAEQDLDDEQRRPPGCGPPFLHCDAASHVIIGWTRRHP